MWTCSRFNTAMDGTIQRHTQALKNCDLLSAAHLHSLLLRTLSQVGLLLSKVPT